MHVNLNNSLKKTYYYLSRNISYCLEYFWNNQFEVKKHTKVQIDFMQCGLSSIFFIYCLDKYNNQN